MKEFFLIGFAMLFLTLGLWAQPAIASTFDGAHYQLAALHPRRHHHHRVGHHHHRRVHRGA
jgi:hypothetical protein